MKTGIYLRRTLAVLSALFVLMLVASASADRYEVVTLGDSPVSYIEHRNSINDSSMVAWTELYQQPSVQNPNPNPKHPRARLTDASNASTPGWAVRMAPQSNPNTTDLHALLTSFGGNFTSDFISRAEDINNDGDVVGYSTDTQLEFRRHAAMWFDGLTVIDLHAAAEDKLNKDYELTAAYGVSERIGRDLEACVQGCGNVPAESCLQTCDSNHDSEYVFVAGYVRESLEVGSIPAVWQIEVDGAPSVVKVWTRVGPGQEGQRYGIFYDVAARLLNPDGNGFRAIQFYAGGGVGGQNDDEAYLEAMGYGQQIHSGGGSGHHVVFNTSPTPATSTINRLEVMRRGGGYAPGQFVATGYRMDSGNTASAFVWIAVQSYAATVVDAVSGNVAIGMGLGMRTDSGVIPDQLQVVGASAVSAGAAGSSSDNTLAATSAFHAYTDYLNGSTSRSCDLDAQVTDSAAGSIEIATDMNSSGETVGWMGTKAVVAVPKVADIIPRFRSLINSNWNFWWVELPGSSIVDGYVIFSDEPGCPTFANLSGSECDGVISNLQKQGGNESRQLFLAANDHAIMSPLTKRGLATAVTWIYNTDGRYFDPNNNSPLPGTVDATRYAQVIGRTASGDCQVSDVIDLAATTPFSTNLCEDTSVPDLENTRDPIFQGVYEDCVGGANIINSACETDILRSGPHCGACGNLCVPACYTGGGACSGGTCTGTPNQDAYEVHDGKPDNDTNANRDNIGTFTEDGDLWGLTIGGLTAFPIDDEDHYEFRVDDYYYTSGPGRFHGGTPTGDQSGYNEQTQPAVQVNAPAGQDLEVTVRLRCNRFPAPGLPAELIYVKTFINGGSGEVLTVSNPGLTYSVTRTVPAGGYRYFEMQPDCGPGGDDSATGASSDPGGYDDGVYVDVIVSHAGGESSCGRQYTLRIGNDVD